MTALHELTVAELAARLRDRKVSAVEAAQHFLASNVLGLGKEITGATLCEQEKSHCNEYESTHDHQTPINVGLNSGLRNNRYAVMYDPRRH